MNWEDNILNQSIMEQYKLKIEALEDEIVRLSAATPKTLSLRDSMAWDAIKSLLVSGCSKVDFKLVFGLVDGFMEYSKSTVNE